MKRCGCPPAASDLLMRVTLCVVGRLRAGPEAELVTDYLTRFDRTGRALGLGPARVVEVEDKKGGGKPAEADLLRKAIPTGAVTCALDERGRVMSLARFRRGARQTPGSGRTGHRLPDRRRRRAGPRSGGSGRYGAELRRHGLAPHARPRDAKRTTLPRRVDFGGQSLSSGINRSGTKPRGGKNLDSAGTGPSLQVQ